MLIYIQNLIIKKSYFMKRIEELIEQIPPLPKMVYNLLDIKKSDSFEISEVLEILEENHFVVSKIMKTVNSKLFRINTSIETLQNAISLYGINFISSLAIVECINSTLRPNLELYSISPKRFFELNEYSCKLMMLWLNKKDILFVEKLIIPAFIQVIGRFLVSNLVEIGKEYKFLFRLKNEPENIIEIEKEFTGFTSNELSLKILEKWNLDSDLISLIKNVDNPNSKESLVLNILRRLFNPINSLSKESIEEAFMLANKYDLDTNSLKNALQELISLTKYE